MKKTNFILGITALSAMPLWDKQQAAAPTLFTS